MRRRLRVISVIWTILCINVLTIAVAFKKRMILYALLNAILLFLATGQAFFIQGDLDQSPTTSFLFNFINGPGFQLALWYVFGISSISLVLAVVSQGYQRYSHPAPAYSFEPSSTSYVWLFLIVCLMAVIMIFFVVGPSDFLNSSRPGFNAGATLFITFLSVGTMPLFFKIIYKCPIARGDIACFLAAFLFTGTMGRVSAFFFLILLLLAVYYTRGWADAPLTAKLILRVLLFGFAALTLFVGYGAIRGAQGFTQGSLSQLLDYVKQHPENSVLSIEWNYRLDIEAMSGTAGALTQYLTFPDSVHFDFGLVWLLEGVKLSLPAFLKQYATPIDDVVSTLNWSPYSIVATGVESFFTSYGWAGMILFPLAMYMLGWWLPLRLQQKQFSPRATYIAFVWMTWEVLFVRGSLASWISASLSYAVVPILFWPLFRRSFKRIGMEASEPTS